MYDGIGYIKVGQLDRVPLCAADDILRQRLHVQVERLADFNTGRLFCRSHEQSFVGALKLLLLCTVQSFAVERLDIAD